MTPSDFMAEGAGVGLDTQNETRSGEGPPRRKWKSNLLSLTMLYLRVDLNHENKNEFMIQWEAHSLPMSQANSLLVRSYGG